MAEKDHSAGHLWKVVMHHACGDGAKWGEGLKFHSLFGKLIVVEGKVTILMYIGKSRPPTS